MHKSKRIRANNSAMQTNSIMLMANVNRSQIEITKTHYNIKSIPITVDDAVMNNVLYPATENSKGMKSMVGNPVTLGHPVVDGQNASGRSGGGLDDHFSGGTISKVYSSAGVWYANAAIKKSLLNAQDGGAEYAQMLDNKKSIGVSTGLMFEDNEISGVNGAGVPYSKTAINQDYDHLAMLANEAPAGGSDTVMRFNVADAMPERNSLANFLAVAKAWFVNEEKNSYNDSDCNENHIEANQDGDSIMNREQIIAILSDKGVSVNAEISDADLTAELTKAIAAPDTSAVNANDEVPSWAETLIASNTALNAKVEELETSLSASKNIELEALSTQMKAMTSNRLSDSVIGKMDTQEMKDHLAEHGKVDFNLAGGQHSNSQSSDELDATCPE